VDSPILINILQGLVNVPIEHHPSIDIISSRYLKVIFKIPKRDIYQPLFSNHHPDLLDFLCISMLPDYLKPIIFPQILRSSGFICDMMGIKTSKAPKHKNSTAVEFKTEGTTDFRWF